MNKKVIAGVTILRNTATNTTFLAGKTEEKSQLVNASHIEIEGHLDIPVVNLGTINLPEVKDENNDFVKELTSLINKYAKENGSNTPDYILASFLKDSLETWNKNVMLRSAFYEYRDRIGGGE